MRLLADFSNNYADSDRAFVDLATSRGASLSTYAHPCGGPEDEALATRVARFGPRGSSRVLFVQSATHGIEGYCGAGGQIGWMREGNLPADITIVLIHAINPYGFAWGLRETQEQVDLNRNFVDHAHPPVANAAYVELHEAFLCGEFRGERKDQADQRLADYRKDKGEGAFLAALATGQYTHPKGLYYGGSAPTWSNITLRSILDEHAAKAEHVGMIDLHSGLGPFGYGMPICVAASGSEQLKRVRAMFGDSIIAPFDDPESEVPEVRGHALGACVEQLSQASVSPIALEFGTYSADNDMNTYRDMLWLRDHAEQADKADATQIRAAFRRHFYPETDAWKEMVWQRTQQVIRQALAGLSQA